MTTPTATVLATLRKKFGQWFLSGAGALVVIAISGVVNFFITLFLLPLVSGNPISPEEDAAQWLFYTIWIAVIGIVAQTWRYECSFDPRTQEPLSPFKHVMLVLAPIILWAGREGLVGGELLATLWLTMTLALYELQVMRERVNDLCGSREPQTR